MTTTAPPQQTNGSARHDARSPEPSTPPGPGASGGASTPVPVDRVGAVWRGKGWILLAALVVAGLTLLATTLVPKTFSSSVQVGLSASPVTGSSVSDLATASNDLAAQYAQVVTSQAVLQPAAQASGTTPAALSSHTASSTLASQNIISITVQAGDPARAQAQADALGASLVDYIGQQGLAAAKQYSDSVVTQLKPLDAQIAVVQKRVDGVARTLAKADDDTAPQEVSAASARLASSQSLLTALSDRRSSLVTQATLQSLSLAPRAQVLGAALPATQVEPRPALYTLVAAIVGLVIATQVVVTRSERRRGRVPVSG